MSDRSLTTVDSFVPGAERWTEQAVTKLLHRAMAAEFKGYMSGLRQRATTTLEDGSTGYFARRKDDCLAAAMATTLQLPIEKMPDPQIDEHLAQGWTEERIAHTRTRQLETWLQRHRLKMIVHTTMPIHRRRWMGIVVFPGWFNDHCVVMNHETAVFDPSLLTSRVTSMFDLDDLSFGVSFQKDTPQRRRSL